MLKTVVVAVTAIFFSCFAGLLYAVLRVGSDADNRKINNKITNTPAIVRAKIDCLRDFVHEYDTATDKTRTGRNILKAIDYIDWKV